MGFTAALQGRRVTPVGPATSLNNLALLYKTQGQYAKADPFRRFGQ